jgi:hypothetical protein
MLLRYPPPLPWLDALEPKPPRCVPEPLDPCAELEAEENPVSFRARCEVPIACDPCRGREVVSALFRRSSR